MRQDDEAIIQELPSEAEEALAAELVQEALKGYDYLLEPHELDALRATLELELLLTGEGRQLLRSCQQDPTVDRSGGVLVNGADKQQKKPKKSSKRGASAA